MVGATQGRIAYYLANGELSDLSGVTTSGGVLTITDATLTTARVGSGGLDMQTYAITNVAAPSAGTDAVNKTYVDDKITSASSGKVPARASTIAALPASTYSSGGKTLTADASGALAAQDGVTLSASDRVLVKNQADASQNGVYIVTQLGDVSNPFILTRASDFDEDGDIDSSLVVIVAEGSRGADTLWYLSSGKSSIVLDTDDLDFAQVVTLRNETITSTTAVNRALSQHFLNSGSAIAPTLADGELGEKHEFLNFGAGTATIDCGAATKVRDALGAASFQNIVLEQGQSVQIVWDGAAWASTNAGFTLT